MTVGYSAALLMCRSPSKLCNSRALAAGGIVAVLFLSHASRDDAAALALEAWLRGRGFTDLFIDHSDIDAGEKWAQALRDAAGACRVVICLVTENWLASEVCYGEFVVASLMGKRIIPLFTLPSGATSRPDKLAKVRADDQGLDISLCLAGSTSRAPPKSSAGWRE